MNLIVRIIVQGIFPVYADIFYTTPLHNHVKNQFLFKGDASVAIPQSTHAPIFNGKEKLRTAVSII